MNNISKIVYHPHHALLLISDNIISACGTDDTSKPPSTMTRFKPSSVFDGTCRWCSGNISPPRRTFCSASCVHEHRIRTSGSYVRLCLFERDKGVCALCGFDTRIIAKQLYNILPYGIATSDSPACDDSVIKKRKSRRSIAAKKYSPADGAVDAYVSLCIEYSIPITRKVWGRKFGGGLWDADHIIPVKLGGGECGMLNYRTLCIACHKSVTWMMT